MERYLENLSVKAIYETVGVVIVPSSTFDQGGVRGAMYIVKMILILKSFQMKEMWSDASMAA